MFFFFYFISHSSKDDKKNYHVCVTVHKKMIYLIVHIELFTQRQQILSFHMAVGIHAVNLQELAMFERCTKLDADNTIRSLI